MKLAALTLFLVWLNLTFAVDHHHDSFHDTHQNDVQASQQHPEGLLVDSLG